MDCLSPYSFYKSRLLKTICVVLAILVVWQNVAYAGDTNKVRAAMKNGVILEGSNGYIDQVTKSLVMSIGGSVQRYPLDTINTVQVKTPKAAKFASMFGGGCAAICFITIVGAGDSEEYDKGQLITGSLLWVAIFMAGGALIGKGAEHWDMIYISSDQSANRSPLEFAAQPSKNGGIRIGLNYRF